MIYVYLCDDEPVWLERLNKIVNNYQIKSDWELSIGYQSASPEHLLQYLKEHTPAHGIYFLDIDFKAAINGLELARQIRNLDAYASIIFITTHDEMVMETFRLKLAVLDYIVKDYPSLEEQVYECLSHIENNFIKNMKKDSSTITIRVAGSFFTILKHDIYYIESIKSTHKICLHLQSTLYDFSGSLSSIKESLGNDFVQCHKTCIVNIRHIKTLDASNHRIFFDNGESCFCSVRKWKFIVQKYQYTNLLHCDRRLQLAKNS